MNQETIMQILQKKYPKYFPTGSSPVPISHDKQMECKEYVQSLGATPQEAHEAIKSWVTRWPYKRAVIKARHARKNLTVRQSLCLKQLQTDFPNTFNVWNFKPLKVGIHQDLREWRDIYGFTSDELWHTLKWYCSQKEYKHLKKRIRYDLEGNAISEQEK